MPSDRTNLRLERDSIHSLGASIWRPLAKAHRSLIMLSPLVVLLVLAGCNSGAMGEARQSQELDESVEHRLSAQQATRTADTFFAATSTPQPEPPVPPVLDTLVITLGVGPDGAPSGSYLSVPADAGTAFAAALLRDVRDGQIVTATWTDGAGSVVNSTSFEMNADAQSQWLAAPLPLNGSLGSGEYAVYIFGGGHQLGSLAFSISGAGSGAQLLPDLPANPQAARATTAPREEEREEENSGGNQEGGQQPAEDTWQEGQAEGDWQQQQNEGNWEQQQDGSWQQPQQQQQWDQQSEGQWPPAEGESPWD